MTAEVAFTRKLIEMGKYARDAQDEVDRLRAFMPANVLREYDRRKDLGSSSARAETLDVGIPVPPRSGETPAAAQALEQIAALAVHISPPVTTIGHRDPWVEVGKRAVMIAREALEESA